MASSYHLFCDFSLFGYECQLQQARRMRPENLRLLHFSQVKVQEKFSMNSDLGDVDLVPSLYLALYEAFSSHASSINLPYSCLWLHDPVYVINA